MDDPALLRVDSVVAGYGKKRVLNGVTCVVQPSEIVALIGHNGAGKSTLLKTVFGLLRMWSGGLYLDGGIVTLPTPRGLLRRKVVYVPQGHRVFCTLTVRENLKLAGMGVGDDRLLRERLEEVLALFPSLRSRMGERAGLLSGGEKQMLVLAGALLLRPRLMLLDEPTLGLAPNVTTQTLDRILQICRGLDSAALIVEQKVRDVLRISDRVYVLKNGGVSYEGFSQVLGNDEAKLREVYL